MERFEFIGYNGIPSFCFIEVYNLHIYTAVIAIAPHRDEKSGTSIDNKICSIATDICYDKDIIIDKMVFIEHHPGSSRPKMTSNLNKVNNRIKNAELKDVWKLLTFDKKITPVAGYTEYPDGVLILTSPSRQNISYDQKERIIQGDINVFKQFRGSIKNKFDV